MRKFLNSILPPPHNYCAKVGNFNKLFLLIFYALISSTTLLTAQSKIWLHGNKIIDLSDSYNIGISNLPTPAGTAGLVYDGAIPQLSEHIEYDSNGNILFFMVDGKIYNKDGYLMIRKTDTAGSLYEFYPEKMLTHTIIKVPGECDKFYIFANLPRVIPIIFAEEVKNFFVGVIDLTKINEFYPNDPDKRGGLVNWNPQPLNYPVNLLNIVNAANADLLNIANFGCGIVVSLDTYVPGNPSANDITTTQFSASWIDENTVLLNTALFGSSNNWKLKNSGIEFLAEDFCTQSENNVSHFYENRCIAIKNNSEILITKGRRTGGNSHVLVLNENLLSTNCITSIQSSNTITSEVDAAGIIFVTFNTSGQLRYVDLDQGAVNPLNFPNILNIPNINFWTTGCHFRRNLYQGVESIYVFHSNGIDVIKGFSTPQTATLVSNVITIPSPTSTSTIVGEALNVTENINYSLLAAGFPNATNLVIAPIQIYNRIDEIVSSSACCVFETNYNAEGNIVVNSNQTWSPGNNPFNNSLGPISVSGDITINPGFKLIIDNLEFHFDNNSDIVVQPGSVLKITNNSKLTSYTCDGIMWQGINVLSTPTVNQFPGENVTSLVGKLIIINSVIEHARKGVEIGTSTSNGGGFIQANNSVFLNCQNGVEFKLYQGSQFSSFTSCRWITNQQLKNPTLTLGTMAYLKDVKNLVIFTDCSFINSAPFNLYSMSQRQVGINSINSSIRVFGTYPIPIPYSSEANPGTSFYQLRKGVEASTTQNHIISIYRMRFQNCNIGLDLKNSIGSIINDNAFSIPNTAYITTIKPRGTIFTGCSAFSFERNSFTSVTPSSAAENVGSMLVNCGGANNLSYRNTYSNLWKGQEIQGNNESPGSSTGLTLRCNQYTNCIYDQYLGDEDYWRQNQGDVGLITRLANNKFSFENPNCDNNLFDMYVSSQRVPSWYFDYIAPNNDRCIPNSSDPSDVNCESNHIQIIVEGNYVNMTGSSFTEHCPTEPVEFINGSGIAVLQQKQLAVDEARVNYQLVVDKNAKQELLSNINAVFPEESDLIKNLLLQKSPLSDEVMKAFILKIDLMDPWHMTQVLLANSPLSKDVLNLLENSQILSGFFMNFIYDSQVEGTLNLRRLLELEISAKETEKHLSLIQLLSQIDSLTASNSLGEVYEDLFSNYFAEDSKKWMIDSYYGLNFSQATAELNSLLQDESYKDWAMLKSFDWSLNNASNSSDSSLVSLLNGYVQNINSEGYALAMSMLLRLDQPVEVIEPEIPLDYRSAPSPINKSFELVEINLAAYPNPCIDNTFITYPKEADRIGYLKMTNELGEVVQSQILSNNGVLEISTTSLSRGVYLLELIVDGKQIATNKLVKL